MSSTESNPLGDDFGWSDTGALEPMSFLTPETRIEARQQIIALLISEGLTDREIADLISSSTTFNFTDY